MRRLRSPLDTARSSSARVSSERVMLIRRCTAVSSSVCGDFIGDYHTHGSCVCQNNDDQFRDCSESTGLLLEDVYRTVRGRTFELGGHRYVWSRGVSTR